MLLLAGYAAPCAACIWSSELLLLLLLLLLGNAAHGAERCKLRAVAAAAATGAAMLSALEMGSSASWESSHSCSRGKTSEVARFPAELAIIDRAWFWISSEGI
jgi:hypothetical protein